jgi:hypothetical protein
MEVKPSENNNNFAKKALGDESTIGNHNKIIK